MAEVEFLLVKEIAEKLRVSERTVYRLIDDGQLEAHRFGLGQGGLRVRTTTLASYIDRVVTTAETA